MAETQSLLRSDDNHVHLSQDSSTIDATRRQTRRFLTSKWGHYSVLALVGLDVASIFADFIVQILNCEGRIHGETTLEVLGIVSLVFSCLFVAELLASIWAFGPRYVATQDFLHADQILPPSPHCSSLPFAY